MHSWEARALGCGDGVHPWEARAASPPEIVEDGLEPDFPLMEFSDSEEADELSPQERMDRQGCEYLAHLKHQGRLSAKQFCIINFYFGEAGLNECKKLGLQPNADSGHFNRKFESVVLGGPCERQKLYGLEVPGHSSSALDTELRVTHTLQTLPGHEQLLEHMRDERLPARFAELRAGGVPPVYEQHPWRHGPDGSPPSRGSVPTGSVYGWLAILSGRRRSSFLVHLHLHWQTICALLAP